MEEIAIQNGDVSIRAEVTGDGPVIVCVHGWPENPHSWRHQVAHFSAAGYRVAAIDVRGYGGSTAPADVSRYTLKELAGDVAAVAEALSDEPVVLFGHDWGAPIVYHTAIRHPEVVAAVAGLSVRHIAPMGVSLLDVFDQLRPDKFFYILHFQEPGVAEAEFEADLRTGLKRVYFGGSGDAPDNSWIRDAPRGTPFMDVLPGAPDGPLAWLPDEDLDVFSAAFERAGMTGGLNRYRAIPFDVEADADIVGAPVDHPCCFIGGEKDLVRRMVPGHDGFAVAGENCNDFRGATILQGVGHWVQQEAPAETNAALADFLGSLS
ncbi:MAG: alpha/beta fold hydrolase [Acidimicrobiales bacterium]